jgi:hypothetical protein
MNIKKKTWDQQEHKQNIGSQIFPFRGNQMKRMHHYTNAGENAGQYKNSQDQKAQTAVIRISAASLKRIDT